MVEDKICVVAAVRPRLVMFLSQNLGIFLKQVQTTRCTFYCLLYVAAFLKVHTIS